MTGQEQERIHGLVRNAIHDSVTGDLLTETTAGFGRPRLSERPLVTYLSTDEQPHFILYSTDSDPNFYGSTVPDAPSRSRRYKVFHVVTDRRWIVVAGNRNGDEWFKFDLDEIVAMNYDRNGRFSGRFADYIVVLDAETAFYEIPVSNDFDEDDFDALESFLRHGFDVTPGGVSMDPEAAGYTVDGIDAYRPDQRTIALLLDEIPTELEDEANEIVANESDAETLVTRLNELIEEYEAAERSVDDIVANATSTDELRESVESSGERIRRRAQERVGRARESVRESDPEEVGRWAAGIGSSAAPLAAAAPAPTTPLLLTAMFLGGGAGVYSSTHEDTPLDDIDPRELAVHANAMANRGAELGEVNGKAIGALLGASSYLGETLAPEEYAAWIVEADPESILVGAEMGAKVANGPDGDGFGRTGAIAGSAYGLFRGYASETWDDADVAQATLDGDLYREYLAELSEAGHEIPE